MGREMFRRRLVIIGLLLLVEAVFWWVVNINSQISSVQIRKLY